MAGCINLFKELMPKKKQTAEERAQASYADAALSRDLAKAIGWKESSDNTDVQIVTEPKWRGGKSKAEVWFDGAWRTFDFKDDEVLIPILQRYHVGLSLNLLNNQDTATVNGCTFSIEGCKDLREMFARAVIQAKNIGIWLR